MLRDTFGREHTYLRISLTDHCNMRCFYCMPDEHFSGMPSANLMNADEIFQIASIFKSHGINKIRLTGGEPLVRKDVGKIIHSLATLGTELTLTTNGIRVNEFIDDFIQCGIKSINISLDTLQPEKFKSITRRDQFNLVFSNIEKLLNNQIFVKLNVVAIDGVNDDEINDFIELTRDRDIEVRFIEFMPFTGNNWMSGKVMPLEKILQTASSKFNFSALDHDVHNTAKPYRVDGFKGSFAIISTMSQPFCASCNRLRLTADGKLKNCLFSQGESDLLTAYRNGEDISQLIAKSVNSKKAERGGQIKPDIETVNPLQIINRSMIEIGG